MTDAPKGRFTFRFAAVCFGLSALWELGSLHEVVPLFGLLVGGIGAVVYHAVYIVLFAWLAYGLWTGSRSGYYALVATSALYTVDLLQFLFVGDSLANQDRELLALMGQLPGGEEVLSQGDMGHLLHVSTITTIAVVILCLWGFVGYAYYRRAYFGINRIPPVD